MQTWLPRVIKTWGQKPLRMRLAVASAIAVVTMGIAFFALHAWPSGPREVAFTELVRIVDGGSIKEARIDGDRVELRRSSGELGAVVAFVGDELALHDLVDRLSKAEVPVTFGASQPQASTLEAATPLLVMAGLVTLLLIGNRRRVKGHFKVASASTTRFDDVAGMDEVKEALEETVQFLKDPQRFDRLGARAPRGVLLTGEPGTGKTLLARAVSNEAGVPFLTCSGSGFQEMFVGVGAARVRSLFAEARKVAPCIVFIDEIDAVGRARGNGADGASTERDQTINQLLVEMDGFDGATGIVVMASTNRPEILDPALLRPGRFDRQVAVPLPDLAGRSAILKVHAKPIDLHQDVDLAHVARQTPGFSGAELANLLNEAAILAARSNAECVTRDHIERARDKVLMGTERKGVLVDEGDRYATAVHEAGHVAVGVAAPNTDPVHRVSILPRGGSLGVTASIPERDRVMFTKEFLEDQICMLLGGRAAEIAILGTMTAGASDDIDRATSIARKMVAELGMSDVGPISLKSSSGVAHSEKLLDTVEEATRHLLDVQLQRAIGIVEARRAEIDALVQALLERDTLDEREILACFPGDAAKPRPRIGRGAPAPTARRDATA